MEIEKPNLKKILSKEETLLDTEKNNYNGCKLCNAGYLENGKICECLKKEIMIRKYNNANIDYSFASLELIEEVITAFLKDDSHPDGKYRSEERTSELQSRPHLVCRL